MLSIPPESLFGLRQMSETGGKAPGPAEEYVGHSVGECNVRLKYFVTLFDSMNE